MKHASHLIIVSLSLMLSTPLVTKPPIKSIDEEGNMTYSDKPVQNTVPATVMPIQPALSEKEAQEQREKIEKQADSAEADRKKAEARHQAKQEDKQKKAASPEAVIIKEDDNGSYYPIYDNPPMIRPPVRPRPPGFKPDLPIYPPGERPPTSRPPSVVLMSTTQ